MRKYIVKAEIESENGEKEFRYYNVPADNEKIAANKVCHYFYRKCVESGWIEVKEITLYPDKPMIYID